jgi:hypothetical protein
MNKAWKDKLVPMPKDAENISVMACRRTGKISSGYGVFI